MRPCGPTKEGVARFLILTNSPRERVLLPPVLPAEHSKSRDGLWPSLSGHLEKAFETFLETLSLPYINNLLQGCRLPSRQGSRRKRFLQSKCEVLSGCAWPNLHQGASGTITASPIWQKLWGLENEMLHSPAGEELSDCSFEFPKYNPAAWAGGLPSCLPGDRAGRGKQMKGGA